MTYLITGAQGFIGRYLTAALLEASPSARVVGVGRSPRVDGFFSHKRRIGETGCAPLPRSVADCFDMRFTYEQADILDTARMHDILVRHRPDTIFHLASALRYASAEDIRRTNIMGTLSLCHALKLIDGLMPKFVLASTGGVYGAVSAELLPARESAPCEPLDPYAATKLVAEQIASSSGGELGLCVIIARIFNVCGPGQDEQHLCGGVAAQLYSGGSTLRVRSVCATRDFIDVRDVARALQLLEAQGECGTVYNVASGIETRIASVVERMMLLAAYEGELIIDDSASTLPNVPRHYGDPSRLFNLGFHCEYELERSLSDLLAFHSHSMEVNAARA